jgi:protection of telomeres protein 1
MMRISVTKRKKSKEVHLTEHLSPSRFDSLRKDQEKLLQLREKLFILWGDLEERKNSSLNGQLDLPQQPRNHQQQQKPSVRPFTCCIKEYGVRHSHCRAREDGGHADNDGDGNDPHDPTTCLGWERRFALFGTTID